MLLLETSWLKKSSVITGIQCELGWGGEGGGRKEEGGGHIDFVFLVLEARAMYDVNVAELPQIHGISISGMSPNRLYADSIN